MPAPTFWAIRVRSTSIVAFTVERMPVPLPPSVLSTIDASTPEAATNTAAAVKPVTVTCSTRTLAALAMLMPLAPPRPVMAKPRRLTSMLTPLMVTPSVPGVVTEMPVARPDGEVIVTDWPTVTAP